MKEGYLLKRSDTLKRWRNRWFWLDSRKGRLLYKESQEDRIPKGVFTLASVFVGPLPSPSKHLDYFCFYVRSSSISLILAAETADVANRWMECIAIAAASATTKASVWRQGSLLPIGPPSRLATMGHPTSDPRLAQTVHLAQEPVGPSLLSAQSFPACNTGKFASTTGSNRGAALQNAERAPLPSLERPAIMASPPEACSKKSPERTEMSTEDAATDAQPLHVNTGPWDTSIQADLIEDTPFQTPLSSGEPSPSTPPRLTSMSVTREPPTDCSPGEHSQKEQAPEEEQAAPFYRAEEPLSNESGIGMWTDSGAKPDEVLWKTTVQYDEPEAAPSISHQSSGFGGFHDATSGGGMLAHETSGDSDAATADSDSFDIQPQHASSGSSTDYARHLGPPFGWPTVTPRFASQYPTPRSRPKTFLYNPAKQGAKSGPTSAPSASSHHGDLTKFSKGQLISMLQMARSAVAAKDEQLALMQSVAQIDARERAKAMAQADESAAQAQAALAKHREQALKDQEERLAKAGMVSNQEIQRLKAEVDGLKKELEKERASRECLTKQLQQMELELVEHAQTAASATARLKEFRSQEARCKELEARLSSLSTRVQGTETALLKPFW